MSIVDESDEMDDQRFRGGGDDDGDELPVLRIKKRSLSIPGPDEKQKQKQQRDVTKEKQQTNEKISRHSCKILSVMATLTVLVAFHGLIAVYHQIMVLQQKESPFDHTRASIIKPLYNQAFCPVTLKGTSTGDADEKRKIVLEGGGDYYGAKNRTATDPKRMNFCSKSTSSSSSYFEAPRMFILNGRSKRPRAAVESWSNENLKGASSSSWLRVPELYNTTRHLQTHIKGCSKLRKRSPDKKKNEHQFHNTSSDCVIVVRETSWAARLFYIYQHVMANILERYPKDDAFILIEDDVQLAKVQQFEQETCFALQNHLRFFSYYTTEDQRIDDQTRKSETGPQYRCTYEFGTQTIFMRRSFMQQLINLPRKITCRLPIDMYIASIGPWLASTNHTVLHLGTRYHAPLTD